MGPSGQGVFAEALVPVRIHAKGRSVGKHWALQQLGKVNRGAENQCAANATSIPGYVTGWAEVPPASPLHHLTTPLKDLLLLPYGATDLRIAEFPTFVANQFS